MKVLELTNEYPPYVYGGAGVHIDNLTKALSRLCDVEVRCFGDQKISKKHLEVRGYQNKAPGDDISRSMNKIHDVLQRCIHFNSDKIEADIVHAHTWYTHFGGILAKLNYSLPFVLTAHSLEPMRPWKREQLGQGYNFSSWVEKSAIEMADAIIAVSQETKDDVMRLFSVPGKKIHVIPNGIDPDEYKPSKNKATLTKLGINTEKPYILFVGRITRQKGIIHLVDAIKHINKNCQVVLCAGAPDTAKIASEMESHVKKALKINPAIHWIKDNVPKEDLIALYSQAAVFCCPSVYEPFGLINIEAMACEIPVVATAVGGIKEVVKDSETGFLVPVKLKDTSHELEDPDKFARDLAVRINRLIRDEDLRTRFGKAGRQRVIENYTWKAVAQSTYDLYENLIEIYRNK